MTHLARNLPALFRSQAARFGGRPGLRVKRDGMWVDVSWSEWRERVDAAALGLLALGLQRGERVAILSENRLEWILADLAILSAGGVTVPLHAPLGPGQVQQMLADSGAALVVASNAGQAAKVSAVAAGLPQLRAVVLMEARELLPPLPPVKSEAPRKLQGPNTQIPKNVQAPMTNEDCQRILAGCGHWALGFGYLAISAFPTSQGQDRLNLMPMGEKGENPPPFALSWQRLEQLGRTAPAELRREFFARQETLSSDDLASLLYTSGTTGASKGVMLTHGNFLSNARAMGAALGPFAADALFFNWLPLSHVYARTVDYYLAIATGATLVLAESAEAVVANLLDIRPTHMSSVPRFYEKLLGSLGGLEPAARRERLRTIFGPRLCWLGCGGAALPAGVAEAYRAAGLEIVVGYGLTESSPVIATNRLGANELGSVGRALPGIEVAIAADGEILTRGPHVMKGYWNQPEATAAVVRDGWLATGDLGRIDQEGYLTITGRKKDLIVLSSGKNVAPTPLEGLLMSSPLIEQAVVFGEGRPFLAAVIVPRDDAVRREIERRGTDCEVAAVLMEHVETVLAEVAPWEKVRKIVIAQKAFSVGGEELTVSMKVRRTVVYERYRLELERLY